MVLVSQICSVALVLSLIYFHYVHPHIRTELNVIFGRVLLLLFGLITSEIGRYITSSIYNVDSSFLYNLCFAANRAICVLFLCNLFNYVIVSVNISSHTNHKRIPGMLSYILLLIAVILSFENFGNNVLPEVYVLSLCFSVLISSIVILFRNLNVLSKSKLKSLFLWSFLYIISVFVKSKYGWDFSSFSCALGLFFLFYSSENPESKLDKTSGFFMAHYIQDYFSSRPNDDLSVGIIHCRNNAIDSQTINNLIGKVDVCCFIDTNDFCYLVGNDATLLHKILLQYTEIYSSVLMLSEHVSVDTIYPILSYAKRQSEKIGLSYVYSIYLSDIQRLDKDDKMHLEIINALMENRIETYVQPIYEIESDSFVSGECLCRLIRRNGELISPGEFIGVAERTGLIVDIETNMFRRMCKCLADERVKNSTIKYLEANLSIKKGEQRDLFEEYTMIANEYGVDSNRVNLEITETDSVDEKLLILNNMKMMKELGFRFSLDDFGTGESNLGYIIDMPVSIIKFDREITQKAMVDDRALTIVKNVIQMVHDLDIKVVVEGVETERDFQVCKEINADYIQGYYFSKPLPMEDFINFVLNSNKNKIASTV